MSSEKVRNFTSMDANRLKDEATRDLLFKIVRYLEVNFPTTANIDFLQNKNLDFLGNLTLKFLEWSTTSSGTFLIPHKLGFIPKDFIITAKTGAGNITINYTSCTNKNISVTTTGACAIRLLYGTYGG